MYQSMDGVSYTKHTHTHMIIIILNPLHTFMCRFTTMGTYIWITVAVTEWRTKFRREMNTHDNAIRQKATDSLLNAETVKLYSGEKYESRLYLDKILTYQTHEWRSLASLALLNCSQSTVIAVGLAAGAMLCGYEVSQGERTVGDFVMFITCRCNSFVIRLDFLGFCEVLPALRVFESQAINALTVCGLLDTVLITDVSTCMHTPLYAAGW